MTHPEDTPVLELKGDSAYPVYRALAHPSRLAIMELLARAPLNVGEIGQALGLSQPTVTKHVQQLESAGLVVSEYLPGVQGMQKRVCLRHQRVISTFEAPPAAPISRVEEIRMPIGLYTLANPLAPCGLASRARIIGFLDKPLSFFDPERASAHILWMNAGFVEYTFPNDLPTSTEISRLDLVMEICSEAPDHNPDFPSDLTVWINGVEIGTWTCPGDFGGVRVPRNPDWWIDHMTQHGLLKIWSVEENGTYIDGQPLSDIGLGRLLVQPQSPVTIRIGVKPDAVHRGGFNLFGAGFGHYAQDLVLRLHYSPAGSQESSSLRATRAHARPVPS